MLNVTNVKRYDYGYTNKSYLNNLNRKSGESISLQSSPIHQSNSTHYSRSTNSTPRHFYVNHLENEKKNYGSNEDTNLDDYLDDEQESSSLEDLNGELNNQNSSNDEYDNSEESNDGEHCTKMYNKQLKFHNQIASKLYDQTFIKHSRSYQNDFFDLDTSSPRPLDKPTSLSLSGNNLSILNNDRQSPGRKKFEMYIMTGDFILNLSKTNSEENPLADSKGDFEFDKGVLNKEKIRKLKEEKRKLITRAPSNNMRNCVTNSDQMRECLSPEIKVNSRTNSQLEMMNNTINDQLTELTSKEESLIVSSDCNDVNLVELSSVKIEIDDLPPNKSDQTKLPDELRNVSPEKSQSANSSDQTNDSSTEIDDLSADGILASKRYPTFLQQTDNSIDEQSMNLHQKSIDEASAKRLARRLYDLDKFRKIDVSRHLSKNNEFNKAVATQYCEFFDFTNVTLIDALKMFLSKFCLIGETQERERILYHFAKRFFNCNPTHYSSIDAIYTLTCSIMLLNQDLHGECVSKKMSLNDFVENLSSLNNGENFARELLKELYNSIKNDKLEWCNDELADDTFNNDTLATVNTILDITNSSNSVEYKRGYLMRKRCLQTNGKKVNFGKRKWKSFYAVLRDTVLYLHKDDQSLMKSQIYNSVKNSIRIHHAVASVASDYNNKKRKFVLRLSTADGSEYLLNVNSKIELDSWIETINFVAACQSAPPTSITSEKKKYPLKSVLPMNNTTRYQFKEQLNDHESRRIRINEEIQEITSQLKQNYNLVDKKAKNKILQLKYLKHEYERYTAYCKVMKKVKQSSNGILEKASKSQLSIKSKPLTNLIIGEESSDDARSEEET